MTGIRGITVAVLAVLVVFMLSAAFLLWVKGDTNAPILVVMPTPDPTRVVPPGSEVSPELPSAKVAGWRVYISGAVRNPGVYSVEPGDRLSDLVAEAGGATSAADLTVINLALRVQDEEYYFIPAAGETPPAAARALTGDPSSSVPSSVPSDDGASKELIDLNTAPADLLATLPGIGPVRAKAIVDFRERNGPFTTVEDVMRIPGIGPATFESLRPLITVGATP